ncbi:MAG: hypothetical protein AAFY57_20645 [Cyanobacteria bacterium J06642_2]
MADGAQAKPNANRTNLVEGFTNLQELQLSHQVLPVVGMAVCDIPVTIVLK